MTIYTNEQDAQKAGLEGASAFGQGYSFRVLAKRDGSGFVVMLVAKRGFGKGFYL